MELRHSFTVPADVDTAWATLLDLEGVAPCFPGATLTGTDGEEFTGQVKVKLGPVSLQYAGKGRFVERDDEAHRAVIEAHGSDKRGNGTAGATVIAKLAQEGEMTTRVTVDTQLKVTGRPAQFGRGVMQDVGSRIVDQFANQLARQLAGEPVGGPKAAANGSASGSAANGSASGSAANGSASGSEANGSASGGEAGAPSAPAQAVSPPAQAASPAEKPSVPANEVAEAAPSLATATVPSAPPRPAAPRPAPSFSSVDTSDNELDLNAVVLPVLARQYGPTLLTVVITAVITWIVARRRK